jgi:hypothetical protein
MFVTVTRPARPYASLADITDKAILDRGWGDAEGDDPAPFFVQFAVNLTADEEAAVRRRLTTANSVEETLHGRALAAYQDLQAFENLATPTNAQILAAVRLLCKVARGLIRLQLRRLDATD